MSRIFRLLGCIRFGEVLLLQGAPVIGLILAPGMPSTIPWATYILFLSASFFLVAHMWMLNDWADAELDALDRNKSSRSFVHKGLKPSMIGGLSLTLLLVSLGLFSLFTLRTFGIALGITALGGLYSVPGIRAKGVVVLSSVIHLSGGALHFLLGYTLFAPPDHSALPLAIFFAVIFTAGHCVQEVQDQEADRLAGVRTNSVVFGKRPMFCIAVLLFMISYLDLIYLATNGLVLIRFELFIIPLFLLHISYAYQAIQLGLTYNDVGRFRRQYRIIMACTGILICL
ncbi:MAG: hypothetical protein C0467_28610 [Planctomycetaceae bacterium]|nr:hypothetical protein [Planctomycetaceae bacterium]